MESVTEAIEFFAGITILLIFVAVIIIYGGASISNYNVGYYRQSFSENINMYLSNSTFYVVNKGASLGSVVLSLKLAFLNGTSKPYLMHIPVVETGTSIYSLPFKNISFAQIQGYSQSGGYLFDENIKNTPLFTINNMYSSSYVFINGKESNPVIQNFSTYYYIAPTALLHLLLYSQYYYYNTTLYNPVNFNLPTTISSYYIEPMLVNETTAIPAINSTNLGQNRITINNKYELIPTNSILNLSYSGNEIKINYCYNDNCNNNEFSNYSGIFSMSDFSTSFTNPTKINIYQNSNATFYLSTEQYNLTASASQLTELLSVPGDLILNSTIFPNFNYSFQVNASGATKWIRNGIYNFTYTTFNDQIVKGGVNIKANGVYILGAKTYSLIFKSNYSGISFSINGHTFVTPIVLALLNNTEYYYNFTQVKQNATEKLVFESQNVCGKTIYTNKYKYFVNQSTTPCTIIATYDLYQKLTLKAYNGTIEAINSTGSPVLISNGSAYLLPNSNLTLKEIPNSGYMFYDYNDDNTSGYSGTNPNPTITMSNSIIEYGYFVPYETITYTETNGTINTNTPYCLQANETNPTINCNVPRNTKVTLSYTPNTNYQFTNWTGTYDNDTSTAISFTANKSITETANSKPIFESLTYTETNGTITSNINSCKEANSTYSTITCSVIKGTGIVLTYSPNSNYEFINWSGTYDSITNPLSFTIEQNTNEIANSKQLFALTYAETNGSITTNIPGCKEANATNPTITCNVVEGEDVSLTYIPDNNYLFTNWTGTQNSLSNPLTFTMNQQTAETANSKQNITYLYMTIQNKQSSATPAPFQQEIIFNANNYTKYESANLGNIRIFNSENQQMNFWCQSGCSNTSTKTILYMKIPNGIPASTTQQYKVEFLNKAVTYNGTTAGEAPQLSSTYAEHDNGPNVFIDYWNFAGTTTPSGVSLQSGFSVNDGLQASFGSGGGEAVFTLPTTYPFIFSIYEESLTAPSWYSNSWAFDTNPDNYGAGTRMGGTGYWSGGETSSPTVSQLPALFSYTETSGETSNPVWNYTNQQSGNSGFLSNRQSNSYNLNSILVYAGNGDSVQGTWLYAYVTAYPPNGIMPTVTFGSVQ